jgi:hypothetical protein
MEMGEGDEAVRTECGIGGISGIDLIYKERGEEGKAMKGARSLYRRVCP